MGTMGRWRAWIVGYLVILATFGLAWWNNPADIGGANESQRAWLAVAFAGVGILLFVPPLAFRPAHEPAAQRTLIVCLAIFMAVSLWWVAFLPSDPFGCSRVNAPDCHTNATTRWRAVAEISAGWVIAFWLTHALGNLLRRRRPETV